MWPNDPPTLPRDPDKPPPRPEKGQGWKISLLMLILTAIFIGLFVWMIRDVTAS